MNGCGVVYVAEFGDRPDLDRLERCPRWPCDQHTRELNWVRDTGLLLAYTEQVRRFEQQRPLAHEEPSLL